MSVTTEAPHDVRLLTSLAWLAATLPRIVAEDCLSGNDLIGAMATGFDAKLTFDSHDVAERVAARLGLPFVREVSSEYAQRWWGGMCGDVEVSVTSCVRAPKES